MPCTLLLVLQLRLGKASKLAPQLPVWLAGAIDKVASMRTEVVVDPFAGAASATLHAVFQLGL